MDNFVPPQVPTALAAVLDRLYEVVGYFVAFPSRDEQIAVTLWIAHTHCYLSFEVTPRLAVLSEMKQSGKTRLLEVIEMFVPHPVRGLNVTTAGMAEAIQTESPLTLLIDEADTIWNGNRRQEQLRALINGGYRQGEYILQKGNRYPTFAPVVLAGIGALPDTIMDRSILIQLRRRRNDQPVSRFRPRDLREDAGRLRAFLATAVSDAATAASEADPAPVEALNDRGQEIWEPLLALADEAQGRWPELAREACVGLNPSRNADVDAHLQLLRDSRTVFDRYIGYHHFVPSTALCRDLKTVNENWTSYGEGYGGLNPWSLRGLLRAFDLDPERTSNMRGYSRHTFEQVLDAYL